MYLRGTFEFESYSLTYIVDAMHRSVFYLQLLGRLARLRLRTQQTTYIVTNSVYVSK